ncbi:hypothetical protein H0H81_002400 [Sphagnurus paluster]|uniref:Uncharacterized protein n=1 Tax=Sphagnurus paluster TaxID=117069 RepID=A0A9P7KGM5_9AGAR|nr:hypothetical protein H0H81_002400 [Sphagnurus paluster]
MPPSHAIWHEQMETHLTHVREITQAAETPLSPFHKSSPPQSEEIPGISGLIQSATLPGPALPGDDEDTIYDDWDGVWFPEELSAAERDDTGFEDLEKGWKHDECPPLLGINYDLDSDDEEIISRNIFSTAGLHVSNRRLSVPESESESDMDNEMLNVEELDDLTTANTMFSDEDWYPWANQSEALLDIVAAFPRSEWANPLVRPHIKVLSEDSGEHLSEPCQAEKWKSEVDPNLSGPMVRKDGKDYFVNEPALTNINGSEDYVVVPPTQWFVQDGKVWAKIRYLRRDPMDNGQLLIDRRTPQCDEIPLTAFFLPFDDLENNYQFHDIPDPKNVTGIAHSGEWLAVERT